MQTVLAVLQQDEDVDDGDGEEVAKPPKCQAYKDATVSLLSEAEAADQISFWNATEVIKNNRYLMSKDPAGLTERIGMGEGKEARKKLKQVCSFLSNARVKFVMEQYKKLKIKKPLFIKISRGTPRKNTKDLQAHLSGGWKRAAKRPAESLTRDDAKRAKMEKRDVVGEKVFIGLDATAGNKDCYFGTVHGKRNVLGREVYDVKFDQDGTIFSYSKTAVEHGMEMCLKQRQIASKNSPPPIPPRRTAEGFGCRGSDGGRDLHI